jgi:hypothetical protein
MGLAHQIPAFFSKELIVDPIHSHRYVAAAIDVCVKLTSIIDEETFLVGAANREQKFFRLASFQIACQPDSITNPTIPGLKLWSSFAAGSGSAPTLPISCHRNSSVDRANGDCPADTGSLI